MIQILIFPKICHLHKEPLTWKAEPFSPFPEGWKCPRCKLVCRVHKSEPLRSNGKGLYCRSCQKRQIQKTPPKPHPPGLSGVSIILPRTSP
jgi:hypothetical protein